MYLLPGNPSFESLPHFRPMFTFNPLSANPTKWLNTLKQLVSSC